MDRSRRRVSDARAQHCVIAPHRSVFAVWASFFLDRFYPCEQRHKGVDCSTPYNSGGYIRGIRDVFLTWIAVPFQLHRRLIRNKLERC
jgi:hypothetical protein